jgi:lipopolysaccharide export system permease protein
MVIGVLGDVLGFLDDIFKNNIPLSSIILFYLYFAPFAFVNMVPFACLISAVYVFNNLSKNYELAAIVTSGISLWKIVRPVLLVTCIICLGALIVNDRVVPPTMNEASRIRKEKLESGEARRKYILKNLAVYGKGDQIIFAREYDPIKKEMYGVIVHKQNEEKIVINKTSARLAEWTENGWLAKDVMEFNIDKDGNFSQEPEVFKKKALAIKEVPSDFSDTQWDPRLMSYRQLKKYIVVLKSSSPVAVRRLMVDLNYKLSFPFTAMVTVLLGIPFSISTGRVNALVGMAKGIVTPMLYLPVVAVCLALGKGGYIPPAVSAWLGIAIFAVWGAYLIEKRG